MPLSFIYKSVIVKYLNNNKDLKMKKILGISLIVATAFFMTGCGGSSGGNSETDVSRAASDILIGKTFYTFNLGASRPGVSYSYEKDKTIGRELDSNGDFVNDVVYEQAVKYEGETVMSVDGGSICHVERMKESVTLLCEEGSVERILWDTFALAKENPDPSS